MKRKFYACLSDLFAGTMRFHQTAGSIIIFLAVVLIPAAAANAAVFTNSAPMNVQGLGDAASVITVTGLNNTISPLAGSVKVTINGFSHVEPDSLGMVLCSESAGRCYLLQDGAGDTTDMVNVTYSLSDVETNPLPGTGTWTTGIYKPANYYTGSSFRLLPGGTGYQSPGPAGGGAATFSSVFGGTNPNGLWTLIIQNFGNGGNGSIAGGWTLEILTNPVAHPQHVADFNGDGKTDFAVVRNIGSGASGAVNQARWFINYAGSSSTVAYDWGVASDKFTPADFDGDGKTDLAVWRAVSAGQPSGNAFFYILNSGSNTLTIEDFGQTGDDPSVVGDYNGDGKADVAVYRAGAATGAPSTWFYRTAARGAVSYVPWGINGDKVAPGDYDGDGRADFVVWRNNGGAMIYWMYQTTAGISQKYFGAPGDTVVPGDYDGDGKTDPAIVRNVAGAMHWWYLRSSTSSATQTVFGAAADLPTPGDYDGDGKSDVAVWRAGAAPGAGAFWVNGSFSGTLSVPLGQVGDYPVANFNAR